MDGFLLGLAAFAIEIVSHGNYDQIAVATFADARHSVNPLSVVICPVEATPQYHMACWKSSGRSIFYLPDKMCGLWLFIIESLCR